MKVNRVGGQESAERRVTSRERRNPLPGPLPGGEGTGEERRVSLPAALLFFVGLGAGVGAIVMGGVFFWPWLMGAARWMGWLVGEHPGLVMVGLIVVAVGALRLSRWVDERGVE